MKNRLLPLFCKISLLALVLCGCLPARPSARPEELSPTQVAAESRPNNLPVEFPVKSIRFSRITGEAGISQSIIACMLQDSNGDIWLGTQDGLNRFNGRTYTVYKNDPSDPTSISYNDISALAEGPDGRLWIGTRAGGVDVFDRTTGRFTRYRHISDDLTSLSGDYILSLAIDPHGDVWIGTAGDGLNRLNPINGEITFYRSNEEKKEPTLSSDVIQSLAFDSTGSLWVGTALGLDRLDPNSGEISNYRKNNHTPVILSRGRIYSLLVDGDAIWVGTEAGLYHFLPDSGEGTEILRLAKTVGVDRIRVTDVLRSSNGAIWATSQGYGIFRIAPDLTRVDQIRSELHDSTTLSDDRVLSVLEDRSGILWFGTYSAFVSQIDPLRNRFYNLVFDPWDPTSLTRPMVWSAVVDSQRRVWLATDGGGLNRYDLNDGSLQVYRHDPGDETSLDDDTVRSVFIDREGTLWVGTQSGLSQYNPSSDSFSSISLFRSPGDTAYFEDKFSKPRKVSVIIIRQDEAGVLWIGTESHGLFRYEPTTERIRHFEYQEGYSQSLTSNLVWALYPDSDHTLWIGTDRGLTRLDTRFINIKNFTGDYNQDLVLSDYRILSIFRDRSGDLWVGTSTGLNRIDPQGRVTIYREKDGLPNDTIYAIQEDDQRRLWISTNRGISRMSADRTAFANFNQTDGLPGNEFNQNCAARASDGSLFFCGVAGLAYFHPDQIGSNRFIPRVRLNSLTQGGENRLQVPADTLDDLLLAWPANYFEFTFWNESTSQDQKARYAYRLDAFDPTWVISSGSGAGRYTNLPGGTYHLWIRSTNSDGIWSEPVEALVITVRPPFWRNPWVIAAGLALALMLVAGGITLRMRGIQKRNRDLSLLVRQRTHEIDQRRQVAEGLRDILLMINSNHPLDESLEFIARQVRELVNAERVLLVGTSKSGSYPILASASLDKIFDADLSVPELRALLLQATDRLDFSVLQPDSTAGDNLPGLREYIGGLALPVVMEERLEAVLLVLTVRENRWSKDEIDLLSACVEQITLVLGNARLRENAADLAMMNERNRLARDLHDAVTQTLFSASLLAEALPSVWENNPSEGRKLIGEMRQLTRGALAEMRSLLMELRPSAMAEAKLSDLLRQLTEAVVGRTGLRIRLESDADLHLPGEVNLALYRIAQEALTNIVKHAAASEVSITARAETGPEGITLRVEDNGRGFDRGQVSPDHFGLYNMQERADSIGAVLKVDSRPGQGTRIIVRWTGDKDGDGNCAKD